MNFDLKKLPARIERAIEWRLERLLKNRRNARSAAIKNSKYASQFRTKWGDAWYNEDIQESKVFYESFSGNNALCNPAAIFNRLLTHPDYAKFQHVWSVANEKIKSEFDETYHNYPNVTSVLYESETYYRELSRSKYLVNNSTFQPAFAKRTGQIYLNTWHGTPLKKMGYDTPGGGQGSYNILRNFVAADYILSPNTYTTTTMLKQAYRLQGIFEGKVLQEGYPRIDAQFLDCKTTEVVRQRLKKVGLPIDPNKEIIVYAPTWKGTSFHSPENEASALLSRIERLQEQFGIRYQFLLKVHQRVYDSASTIPGLEYILIPNSIPTNEVLSITDILITDYSSIFFDFLSTRRPILFHVPDHIDYDSNRGFYLDLNELPGPTSVTLDQLSTQIESLGSGDILDAKVSHAAAYQAAVEKFCEHDDGGATDRVIDVVFGNQTAGYNLVDLSKNDKTKILIFLGGMKPNGITSAALNLLSNLNYDKFDVSIMVPGLTRGSSPKLYSKIDSRVRQFLRTSTFPATIDHLEANESFLSGLLPNSSTLPSLVEDLLDAEWHRIFGQSRFDHIVDFSGYAGFWSLLLRQGTANNYSVWLHSNLKADAQRNVDGKLINEDSLQSQFRAYQFYDNLISVSKALADINAHELAEYAPAEKFKHVSNTLDIERFELQSNSSSSSAVVESTETLVGSSLGHALQQISMDFTWKEIEEFSSSARRYSEIFPDPENLTTFVTVGRLSPEKNHERLIRAFAITHQCYPQSRLVIAGDGPMKPQLASLIRDLQLTNYVRLLGHVDDGLEIMSRSDCFVLSSDYEGQPMVILEARAVSLPVITVQFGSVDSILKADEGLIVPMSIDGLARGMNSFVKSGVIPSKSFDPVGFNDDAMHEFYEAILF
jgi:CDP-glycerol glycerophosphotransferase